MYLLTAGRFKFDTQSINDRRKMSNKKLLVFNVCDQYTNIRRNIITIFIFNLSKLTIYFSPINYLYL